MAVHYAPTAPKKWLARRDATEPAENADDMPTMPDPDAPVSAAFESVAELNEAIDAALSGDEGISEVERPRVRADCLPGGVNEERPCPWASCRYHLVHLRRDGLEPDTMDPSRSCVLDV